MSHRTCILFRKHSNQDVFICQVTIFLRKNKGKKGQNDRVGIYGKVQCCKTLAKSGIDRGSGKTLKAVRCRAEPVLVVEVATA